MQGGAQAGDAKLMAESQAEHEDRPQQGAAAEQIVDAEGGHGQHPQPGDAGCEGEPRPPAQQQDLENPAAIKRMDRQQVERVQRHRQNGPIAPPAREKRVHRRPDQGRQAQQQSRDRAGKQHHQLLDRRGLRMPAARRGAEERQEEYPQIAVARPAHGQHVSCLVKQQDGQQGDHQARVHAQAERSARHDRGGEKQQPGRGEGPPRRWLLVALLFVGIHFQGHGGRGGCSRGGRGERGSRLVFVHGAGGRHQHCPGAEQDCQGRAQAEAEAAVFRMHQAALQRAGAEHGGLELCPQFDPPPRRQPFPSLHVRFQQPHPPAVRAPQRAPVRQPQIL